MSRVKLFNPFAPFDITSTCSCILYPANVNDLLNVCAIIFGRKKCPEIHIPVTGLKKDRKNVPLITDRKRYGSVREKTLGKEEQE